MENSASIDLIVVLWKILLDLIKSYEMSCTSDTIHMSEDDANVGIIGEIVVASLPPRSVAGIGSNVGANAISDEIVDFFREFDKRTPNPHLEWHFWRFNGPLVSFGDFWVPSDSVPYLQQLITKHGNFVAKFKLGAGLGGPMSPFLSSMLAAMSTAPPSLVQTWMVKGDLSSHGLPFLGPSGPCPQVWKGHGVAIFCRLVDFLGGMVAAQKLQIFFKEQNEGKLELNSPVESPKCRCSKFLRLPRVALQMVRAWAELFRGDVEPKTRHQTR
uniref:Uncharacterized protein n=1 Tax=Fagus sylvatica TaxID=28930 RepID=A0A2N9GEW3_FAGSY